MSAVTFVLFSLLISSIMLSVIFLFAWRTMGRKPHALTWSLAFVVGASQWACNLIRAHFPTHDLYWVTVGALAIVTVSLGLVGHRQRVGKSTAVVPLGVAGTLVFLTLAGLTFLGDHDGWKLSLGPLYAAVILSIVAGTVVQKSPSITSAEWGTAVVNVILALSQIVAVAPLLSAGSSPGPEALQFYSAVNFLVTPAAYIGIGMFAVFLLASDLSEEMKAVATRDQLTGVLNRRGLAEVTKRLFSASRRGNGPLSLILADIDRFKKINDQYGHAAGDQVLLHFSSLLAADRRGHDAVARIGGEEFVVVLPGTSAQEAAELAEQLRFRTEQLQVTASRGTIEMTASFGIATLGRLDRDFEAMLARADVALYRCKAAGRNCVEQAQPASIRSQHTRPKLAVG